MKRLFNLIFLTLLTLMFAMSCEKNISVPQEDDETAVTGLAQGEDEDYLFDEGFDDGSEDNMYNGYSSFGKGFDKITSPIDTVHRFGRKIMDRPRRVITDVRRISPDSIKVFVAREFVGRFIVIEKEDDTTFVRHVKDLRHVVRRCALYVKRNPTDEIVRRRWKLAEVSLGQGNSLPAHTIRISQVSVSSSSGINAVFTDPLHTMLEIPEDILTFALGEEITVQVKLTNSTANPVDPSGNGSTETVLLHYGTNRHHHARRHFEYAGTDPATGEQIYEGTWTIGQEPFQVYHAVVDAIDNGTIFDDDGVTYPYNSTTWSVPYRVVERD